MSDENILFLRMVLRGKRFESHLVPVDVLEEFSRYQRLILDLAKAIYFQRHPERKRVPRGFMDQFKLSLKNIEPGSAAPILYHVPSAQYDQQVELPIELDIFTDAQALLVEYIDAISRGAPAPPKFPSEVLSLFKSFGKTMKPDESMEFILPKQESGPRYDIETRQKIVRLQGDNYEETVEKIGNVRSVNTRKKTFRIETKAGEMVEADYRDEYEDDLLGAHKAYRAFVVRIEATGIYSPNGELKKVTDISDLSLQDDGPDLENRIDELAKLQNGWFDGDGRAIKKDLLNNIRSLLSNTVYEHNCFIPRIYPTPEGGVQVEWSFGEWDIEIEFASDRSVTVIAEHRAEELWNEWEASVDDANLATRIAGFVNERSSAGENLGGVRE